MVSDFGQPSKRNKRISKPEIADCAPIKLNNMSKVAHSVVTMRPLRRPAAAEMSKQPARPSPNDPMIR